MSQETIKGPQGSLHLDAETHGRGLPVLFVHSDAGNLHHWDEMRRRLKRERPTAAFDRRGHGRSDPPRNGSFAQKEMVQDIAAVADALGWSRFVLVGHSGGAANAFTFAGEHPSRVAGLILVDPVPDPAALPRGMMDGVVEKLKGEDWLAFAEQHFGSIAGDDPQLAERLLEEVRSTPQATLIGAFEASRDFRPTDYALRIPAATLSVIQSQYDVPGALHRLPPGIEKVTVDGAGHWIHLGAPDRFADILDAFLEDLDDRERSRIEAPAAESAAP